MYFLKYFCNFLDELLHPYKFHGSEISGKLFFIFGSCELLNLSSLLACYSKSAFGASDPFPMIMSHTVLYTHMKTINQIYISVLSIYLTKVHHINLQFYSVYSSLPLKLSVWVSLQTPHCMHISSHKTCVWMHHCDHCLGIRCLALSHISKLDSLSLNKTAHSDLVLHSVTLSAWHISLWA